MLVHWSGGLLVKQEIFKNIISPLLGRIGHRTPGLFGENKIASENSKIICVPPFSCF
jgi:hypothetical protein